MSSRSNASLASRWSDGDVHGNVVAFAIDQPEDTTVSEFTVGPANQAW